MGWIKAGNIEFYSVADTINEVVMALFYVFKSLVSPFFFIVLILFTLSLFLYFYVAVKHRIESDDYV